MVWKQLNYPVGGKEERKGQVAKDDKKLILELFILLHWQIIPYRTLHIVKRSAFVPDL